MWNLDRPAWNGWQHVSKMPEPARINYAFTLLDGKAYLFGGVAQDAGGFGTCPRRGATTSTGSSWVPLPAIPVATRAWAAAVWRNYILLLGGYTDQFSSTVLSFSPKSREFTYSGRLPRGIADARFLSIDGDLFVTGGESGMKIGCAESWRGARNLPRARRYRCLTQGSDPERASNAICSFHAIAFITSKIPRCSRIIGLPALLKGTADGEALWTLVRHHFAFPEDRVPMNAANLCPSPRGVADAAAELTRDIDRDFSARNREKFGRVWKSPHDMTMIGATPDEVALVRNTSEAATSSTTDYRSNPVTKWCCGTRITRRITSRGMLGLQGTASS